MSPLSKATLRTVSLTFAVSVTDSFAFAVPSASIESRQLCVATVSLTTAVAAAASPASGRSAPQPCSRAAAASSIAGPRMRKTGSGMRSLTKLSMLAALQPLGDGPRQEFLRAAADVDADVPAVELEGRIVAASSQALECARGCGRHQVVLQRVDVEDGAGDLAEVDRIAADLQSAPQQAVFLEQATDELAKRRARLVGAVVDPALHAQEVLERRRVCRDVGESRVLAQRQAQRHQREERGVQERPRHVAEDLDHAVDVDLAHPRGQQVVTRVKIDGGHHRDEVAHAPGMQRRVTERERPALAYAEQVHG